MKACIKGFETGMQPGQHVLVKQDRDICHVVIGNTPWTSMRPVHISTSSCSFISHFFCTSTGKSWVFERRDRVSRTLWLSERRRLSLPSSWQGRSGRFSHGWIVIGICNDKSLFWYSMINFGLLNLSKTKKRRFIAFLLWDLDLYLRTLCFVELLSQMIVWYQW